MHNSVHHRPQHYEPVHCKQERHVRKEVKIILTTHKKWCDSCEGYKGWEDFYLNQEIDTCHPPYQDRTLTGIDNEIQKIVIYICTLSLLYIFSH